VLLSAEATSGESVAAWIDAVAARRDLGLPPPSGAAGVERPAALLATLAAEFAEYRAVVADARDAARRNAEQLAAIVASTSAQGELAGETATAVTQAGTGAADVTDAAEALRDLAASAAAAVQDASGALGEIGAALGALGEPLAAGIGPLQRVTAATAEVGAFTNTLERLSRHAQLLSVNAAIEAAYLGEGGARFRIVAQEVRKLSRSTRDSAREIGLIASALDGATRQVAAAIAGANEATAAARCEVEAAASTLAQTRASIAELGETIAGIAAV
jgi:methyl-accepting chemotaxis protein